MPAGRAPRRSRLRDPPIGWTSGRGRFGAAFGPWLGGQLLAANDDDRGFTAFALAAVSSTVLIGVAALRGSRTAGEAGARQELIGTH